MSSEHPITPPPELVREWFDSTHGILDEFDQEFATKAARWGADQEVGACYQWLLLQGYDLVAFKFRAARRPAQ